MEKDKKKKQPKSKLLIKPKVNIIDHNKIETKNNLDLNDQVKNIFSNKG